MLHHSNESDEHLVRRLEGFSDVVIGFSLAELTVSLSIPAHFSELLTNGTWIVAYLWTFSLVCYAWFEHHRLFASVFIPRAASMLLNFAWLASIGLIVYVVQLLIHFESDVLAARLIFEWYFGLYAANLFILSALYLLGLRGHSHDIPSERLIRFREAVTRFAIAGTVVLLVVIIGPLMNVNWFFWTVPMSVGYGFVIAGIILRLRRRRSSAISGQ